MAKFTMNISAMVTIIENEDFTVEASSAEEAEKECREMFKLRMWEKHGYADYNDEIIEHYCNDWEAQ